MPHVPEAIGMGAGYFTEAKKMNLSLIWSGQNMEFCVWLTPKSSSMLYIKKICTVTVALGLGLHKGKFTASGSAW